MACSIADDIDYNAIRENTIISGHEKHIMIFPVKCGNFQQMEGISVYIVTECVIPLLLLLVHLPSSVPFFVSYQWIFFFSSSLFRCYRRSLTTTRQTFSFWERWICGVSAMYQPVIVHALCFLLLCRKSEKVFTLKLLQRAGINVNVNMSIHCFNLSLA